MLNCAAIRGAGAVVCLAMGLCRADAEDWNVSPENLALSNPIAGGPMTGIMTYPTKARTRSPRIGSLLS